MKSRADIYAAQAQAAATAQARVAVASASSVADASLISLGTGYDGGDGTLRGTIEDLQSRVGTLEGGPAPLGGASR